MSRYLVRFTTTSGDNDKEWCTAYSASEAAEIIKGEHWNIKSIDSVEKL